MLVILTHLCFHLSINVSYLFLFHLYFDLRICISICLIRSVDIDPTSHFSTSDLGLRCLPMFHEWDKGADSAGDYGIFPSISQI